MFYLTLSQTTKGGRYIFIDYNALSSLENWFIKCYIEKDVLFQAPKWFKKMAEYYLKSPSLKLYKKENKNIYPFEQTS